MNAGLSFRRYRTILDCFLIVLIILALTANDQRVLAGTRYASSTLDALLVQSTPLSNPGPADLGIAGGNQTPDQALLDNNTLAAMFAAENAALFSSQYFLNIPLVTH